MKSSTGKNSFLFRLKIVTSVVSLLGTQLLLSNIAHAATIDDLRELLGQPRLDHTFTQQQKDSIVSKYSAIHQHNIQAQLINSSDPSSLNAEFKAEDKKYSTEITIAEDKLKTDFSSGAFIDSVLQDSSRVTLINSEKSQVPKQRAIIKMKIEKNPYKAKYNKILSIDKAEKGYVNIGLVGNLLQSPVDNKFILLLPYGSIKNEKTGKTSFNNGLNLEGSNSSKVISVWNGTVTSVSKSSVVVANGNGIDTFYSHLGKVVVSKGQHLDYYDEVGTLGIAKGTTNYLHFGVKIAGNTVDPVYFFGSKGRQALQSYISATSNPSIKGMQSTVFKIKDQTSEQAKVTKDNVTKDYGKQPVNYDQSKGAPKGSTKITLKSGYSMPDSVGPISGLGGIILNERH